MDSKPDLNNQQSLDRLRDENSFLRAALEKTDQGKELVRQREEFSLLLAFSKLIVSELSPDIVFPLVASKARELIQADTLLVPMLNDSRDKYTYKAVSGVDAEVILETSFPITVGMCGWVLQNKRSLLFGESSPFWLDEMTTWERGQQSALLVPLFGRNQIIGGLSALGKQGGGSFTTHDLDLLTVFANQVSTAIENATLFQQVQREVEIRRQTEHALKKSEENLAFALDATNAAWWEWNFKTGQTTYSPFYYQMLGYQPNEFPSHIEEWEKRVHPDDRAMTEKFLNKHLIEKKIDYHNLEIRMMTKDGQWRWISGSGKIVDRDEEGNPIRLIGTNHDITERKQAEEKIQQSEKFIRSILDTVDEGFIVIDRDYRIQTANKAYCRQVGGCDEVIGRHCYEVSHKSNRPCYEEHEDCATRVVFETGKPCSALHRHEETGGTILYVETKAFPIKDASGAVTSVIETINNITEKHLLEEERLKTQKLESIGTLAGGIAHDFNNLLQGVFGYISLAKMSAKNPEKCTTALEQAEKALHQSVNLTTQLLTFSKGGKPAKKQIALRPIIENSAMFTLSGSWTDLRISIPEDLWQVEADGGQLGQVIQNIVLNADQSMPMGGTVKITAANLAKGDAALPSGLQPGDYVMIAIHDTGVGIPEQYLSKIFDPYFTTKEKGSGLGLATTYSIVRNHGGMIDVRSKSGVGSTFTIYLPALVAEAQAQSEEKRQDPSLLKGARILVMDDDEVIRNLSSELLGLLGHDVEVAKHGQEVLEKYQKAISSGRPFDLVILDLTVRGGMGGVETIQQLLKIDPLAKAIVSSGYSDDAAIANYLSQGFKACLKKPYDVDALKEVLHKVLGSNANA